MEHLYLLFQLINFIQCISLLIFISFYMIKSGEKYVLYYFFYLLSFITIITVRIMILYIGININNFSHSIVLILQLISLLSILSLFLFHKEAFFSFVNIKVQNVFYYFFAIFILIFIVVDIYFLFKSEKRLMSVITYISLTLYYFFVVISFVVFILNYRFLSTNKKNILKALFLIFIVFSPFLIFDNIKHLFGVEKYIAVKHLYFQTLFIFFFFSLNNIVIIKALINIFKGESINPTISSIFITKFLITNREKEIIESILSNLSNKEICEKHFISISTVKTHINNIFKKVEARNRKELIQIVKKHQ